MVSEAPIKPNEIVQIDTWFLNKSNMFLTCIDKFTMHVSIHPITGRNSITIVEILKHRFAILGRPCKIVADNEFNTAYIKNFLSQEDVMYHFTSPNTHTGNSVIERFHLTLNEHIRLFKLNKENKQTDDKTLFLKQLKYIMTLFILLQNIN